MKLSSDEAKLLLRAAQLCNDQPLKSTLTGASELAPANYYRALAALRALGLSSSRAIPG